jgi:uncharacterized protein (DUF1778 family)
MFGPKFKVSQALYDKVKQAAELLGSASVEEFVERTLEREAEKVLNQNSAGVVSDQEVEKISSKLKGLGYLE